MTKTCCDICGEEIVIKPLATDDYWIELRPHDVVRGMKDQVCVSHEDICFNCAQSISRYLNELKMAHCNI